MLNTSGRTHAPLRNVVDSASLSLCSTDPPHSMSSSSFALLSTVNTLVSKALPPPCAPVGPSPIKLPLRLLAPFFPRSSTPTMAPTAPSRYLFAVSGPTSMRLTWDGDHLREGSLTDTIRQRRRTTYVQELGNPITSGKNWTISMESDVQRISRKNAGHDSTINNTASTKDH